MTTIEETGTSTRKTRTTPKKVVKELIKMTKKTFNASNTDTPIIFDIDGEEFEAIPADRLPAGALADYFKHIQEGDLFKAHEAFFETVLTEDSNTRFNERLNSRENPITVSLLGDIAAWLLGDEYMGGAATEEPDEKKSE